MKRSRGTSPRPSPPPPLEANDRLVTVVGTAGWAIALVVLLIVRGDLPADARWWIWTAATGVAMGLFALWYVPRYKRARARGSRSAARRARGRPTPPGSDQPGLRDSGQPGPRDSDQPGLRDSGQPGLRDSDQPGLRDSDQPGLRDSDQSAPRDNGSKTVSSTETPGKSTMS